jgi:hypothetical protein
MVIERINNEIVLRMSALLNFEAMQRMIDLMSYKETTARSEARQEDIDLLAKEANRDWWKKNRSRFIK